MHWTFRILIVVVMLLLAYLAWPLFGLKRIANAIEARDAAAFTQLLDLPELKRSLAAQIVRAHLKVTGRDQRLSPLALNLAVRAGVAIADSYVIEIVKADALMSMLKQARSDTLAGAGSGGSAPAWSLPNLRNTGRFLASEYRGRNFYITLPLSADPKDGFRLRLRLTSWKWKLAGIGLPEEIQLRLGREFLKRSAP